MKKSKIIKLVLVGAALAGCSKPQPAPDYKNVKSVAMRSDTTGTYTVHHSTSPLVWYYAFHPYGFYSNGVYHRSGFYSSQLSQSSNFGSNTVKSSTASRNGFGSTAKGTGSTGKSVSE